MRVVRACVCGSDLHPYHSMPASAEGSPMGHEFIGVVEEIGSEVATVKAGDFVIAPFAFFDNTCEFCREGLTTSACTAASSPTAQAEAVRVPQADGTLVKAPVGEDSALLPSLLTLSDVLITGHHAAVHGRRERPARRSRSSATARSACWRCSPPSGWAPSRSS